MSDVQETTLPQRLRHVLPNGLRVLIAPKKDLPLVALRLVVEGGSAADPPAKRGVGALCDNLLLRGTERRDADALHEAIEGVGGSLDSGTGRDASVVAASVPSDALSLAVELLAEVATQPAFPPDEVRAEKERVLAELAQTHDDPASSAERLLLASALPEGHPYAIPPSGTQESVARVRRDDVVRAHQRRFLPGRAILVVVGDVEPEAALRRIRRRFGGWSGEEGPTRRGGPAHEEGGVHLRLMHRQEASQVQVGLATPIFASRQDPDFFPAVVANSALGGGFTSRLIDAIRVERGLSYSASTRLAFLREAGFLLFRSFTKNESLAELLSLTLDEVAKVRSEGFDEEELDRAQRYLCGIHPLRYETNEQIAAALADLELFGLPSDWVERYRERVRAVTPEQAHDVARRHFFAEGFGVTLVGEREAVRRGLREAGLRGQEVWVPPQRA